MRILGRTIGRSPAASYDALNPVCAPIYHRVFDKMSGQGASKKAFDNPQTRQALDAVLSSGRLSRSEGLVKAERDFCIFTVGRLGVERDAVLKSSMADFFKANKEAIALDSGARHVRDLVFAAAPALAFSPADIHEVTIRMAFCLKGMLARETCPFLRGAGRAFMIFGMEFDLPFSRRDQRSTGEDRLGLWLGGYELAV